jgi:hypothetical protein
VKHVVEPFPLDRACGISLSEYEFELAQPFLFGLSGILYQIEPYMETIGYGISFIVFH